MRRRTVSGARVLLTGASSGIGRALAVRLAERGAVLALTARRTELLDEAAEEIADAGHLRPRVLPADLAVPGVAAELGQRALATLGGIDLLINNAGANMTAAQAVAADDEQARAVFETNLWTPLALTKAVLPAMRAAGRGVIVNTTSTVQAIPIPLLGYYAASKAALARATSALRLELAGTGIRVVEVVPGSTDTALRDIDELPWKGSPPPTLPAISPEAMAAAIVRALERGRTRVVHPGYSRAPLEVPVVGRLVAALAATRVDTRRMLDDAEPGTDWCRP
ncbi:SDR family oxidoreductase [Amycolatopsis ultiminotia]|uniref:SDR family oxidoreductase n=1 Tax=Amycolatopsis ultiminotia TaxID=543629 RepID=A0ABP6WBN2_9PSEU